MVKVGLDLPWGAHSLGKLQSSTQMRDTKDRSGRGRIRMRGRGGVRNSNCKALGWGSQEGSVTLARELRSSTALGPQGPKEAAMNPCQYLPV